nr:retrovirus-related Pol polyprotein from transposon TNT 1-94 [Tanacetum cinerariifolium]
MITSLTTENANLKAELKGNINSRPAVSKKPKVLAPGVKFATETSKSKSNSDTRTHRILPHRSEKARRVEDHLRDLNKKNHVYSSVNIQWCSRHMTGDRSKLINFVEKFIGTVRFGNDQFAVIVGYGDYKIGDTIITRVYYVKGLSHNLFSVGQFCDAGLELAFRQHTCHIRNKDKVDLLKGSRITNMYYISLKDMMEASPVCLLSKAFSIKTWLWHRRLNHLNFRTRNKLARKDLVRGIPKLKYEKEHLCPSCQLSKSKGHLIHLRQSTPTLKFSTPFIWTYAGQ